MEEDHVGILWGGGSHVGFRRFDLRPNIGALDLNGVSALTLSLPGTLHLLTTHPSPTLSSNPSCTCISFR